MAMQMNIFCLTLTIIVTLWLDSAHGANTLRYASSCSVDLCTLKNTSTSNGTNGNGGNSTCLNLPLCYQFDTSLNTSVCAPQVICSLFDPCSNVKRCATNTSVCVINTCCSAPICMPLALTTSCSMYVANNVMNSGSYAICPNATWSDNSTIVLNNYLGNNYWANLGDFLVDTNNNLYVIDTSGYRVLKFALNNPTVYSVAAVTNYSSNYQPSSLSIDTNGGIYTAESSYQPSTMSTVYQIVRYNQTGLMNGTIVYGPNSCGTGLSNMCWSAGLFVDRTGSIYYSDASNHRILKITPFASSATVVAGISGVSGSALNQLYSPGGIYVDGNGALYVADQSNYRVMKFTSGSLTGTVLFTMPSFQSPISVILDNSGNVYAGTYNGIFRYVPVSSTTVQVVSQNYWGVTRVHFDTYGNMYTSGFSSSNIYRYNITTNTC